MPHKLSKGQKSDVDSQDIAWLLKVAMMQSHKTNRNIQGYRSRYLLSMSNIFNDHSIHEQER